MNAWYAMSRRAEQQTCAPQERVGTSTAYLGHPRVQPQAESRVRYVESLFAGMRLTWGWLQGLRASQRSARRLRMGETISFGEKRFVSILYVDGTQFLIGGSAGSVQLLAMLDQATAVPPLHHQRETI